MELYLGTIILVPFTFAPQGTAECAGQILPISQYQALFSLLGANFGGDGTTTFALPDLREKTPHAHTKYIIVLEGIYPSRV